MFIAAVMSQAAGCIFVSDDDGDSSDDTDDTSDGENAVIDVGWTWLAVDGAGATSAATCPPGTSITVHTQEVDANGDPVGQEILDIYDCETNSSITPPLPPSTVSVYLSGTGGAGDFTSFTQFVDLTTTNEVVDFDLIANGGYIQFAWELVGGTTNTPLACEDVSDLDGIGAIVTVADTPSQAFDFQYTCQDGFGTTDPLAADDYVISIDAFNAANESISEEPFNQNVTVGAPNDIVEIGTVQIPIADL
jgi:hypothetical protein